MKVPAGLLLAAAFLLAGCAKSAPPGMKVCLTHETGDGEYVVCSQVSAGGDFEVSSFSGSARHLSLSGSVTKQGEGYHVSVRYQLRDAPGVTRAEGLVRTEVNTQVRVTENEWLRIAGSDNETIAIRIWR